ncbi:MAG: sulfite exporter TauE/SafE family protein, partial [Armatimonadota bacterium]
IGTSLVIIAVNSFAGFVAHLSDVQSGTGLGLAFTAAALAGLFAGMALGKRMQPQGLKVIFGGISLGVAAYLIVMNARPLWALLG